MYLGVVACPQLRHGFDGRVCLHRVSQQKTLARLSRNTRYSVDVDVVQSIKTHEWAQLFVTEEGMTAEDQDALQFRCLCFRQVSSWILLMQ